MSSVFLKLLKVNAPVSSRRSLLRGLRMDWSEKGQIMSKKNFFCLGDNMDQRGIYYI